MSNDARFGVDYVLGEPQTMTPKELGLPADLFEPVPDAAPIHATADGYGPPIQPRGPVSEDVHSALLTLAEVRLHELLSNRAAAAATTLDQVMRRLFDPQNQNRSPISGFGSAL